MAGGGGKNMGKDEKAVEKCTICEAEFSDLEGGAHGYIGILPVSFCPFCLSGILEMSEQMLDNYEPT